MKIYDLITCETCNARVLERGEGFYGPGTVLGDDGLPFVPVARKVTECTQEEFNLLPSYWLNAFHDTDLRNKLVWGKEHGLEASVQDIVPPSGASMDTFKAMIAQIANRILHSPRDHG